MAAVCKINCTKLGKGNHVYRVVNQRNIKTHARAESTGRAKKVVGRRTDRGWCCRLHYRMLAVYLRHTQMLTNLFEEFIRHLATACPRSIDCPVDIRTLAAAEQLRRRQTTSCQVGCRWPPTHEAPLPRRNELIIRNFALVTRLTHCFYLLAGVDQPQCAIFQCPLSQARTYRIF